MLSILVPVFNVSVIELVRGLIEQGQNLQVPFEIIVLDDASEIKFIEQNRTIEKWDRVRFFTTDKNLGRSAARNKLASLANYSNLLFIDSDAAISSDQYLRNYLPYLDTDRIVCGGTLYRPHPPEDKELMLRWKYGIKREARSVKKRKEKPNAGFSSFNFLIDKDLFMSVQFEEIGKKYGHEDTLFGYLLFERGEKIKHTDNPLYHLGLEEAGLFIEKTRAGLENLYNLTQRFEEATEFIMMVRLLRLFYKLKKIKIVPFPKGFTNWLLVKLEKKLKNPKPNLIYLDLYKLLYYNTLYFSPSFS